MKVTFGNENYIDYDFFDKIDNDENYVKYIIASDTDSEYIYIPFLDFNKLPENEISKLSNEIGNDINTILLDYNKNFLLPKLGISNEYDFTEFKNELVADAFLTLKAKKNYAYREVIKNKLTEVYERKIKFKGIATVRNDFNELTKRFISNLINNVIFSDKIHSTSSLKTNTENIGMSIYSEIVESVNQFKYTLIGKPSKWSIGIKDPNQYTILAAKLFNTLVDEQILLPGSTFLIIPIQISDKNKFLNKISSFINKNENYICTDLKKFEKLTNLGIPFEYNDIDFLKKQMDLYSIIIDIDKIKDTVIYGETVNKIIDCIKNNKDDI